MKSVNVSYQFMNPVEGNVAQANRCVFDKEHFHSLLQKIRETKGTSNTIHLESYEDSGYCIKGEYQVDSNDWQFVYDYLEN